MRFPDSQKLIGIAKNILEEMIKKATCFEKNRLTD